MTAKRAQRGGFSDQDKKLLHSVRRTGPQTKHCVLIIVKTEPSGSSRLSQAGQPTNIAASWWGASWREIC